MEYFIGVMVGAATAAFGQLAGFDRSRNFYPIALIVIASYYELFAVMSGDLIATVPDKHTGGLRGGMHSFPIPLPVSEFTISLLWHPRLDGDPAHRWLRETIREACRPAADEMGQKRP